MTGWASGLARWTVFVPGPLPGLNQLLAAAKRRDGNGWSGYAAVKRDWERRIALAIAAARPPRFDRAWLAFRWWEPSRRRDPDNVAAGGRKLLLDVLVRQGVLPADGWRRVVGWADRFGLDPRRPGVALTVIGRRLAAWALFAVALLGGVGASWASSPLNLSPDWPLRLDDAYPVPAGEWQWQQAVRQESAASANRFTLRSDVRIGLTREWELDLGFTPAQAGHLGGDVVDHRAVRAGVLARLTQQDGALPSQAIRVTVAPPIAGPSRSPMLRADWLQSWKLPDKRTWVHLNASYLVAPDPFPGGVARTDWWQGRIGLVHALTVSGVALAGSVGAMPSPFEARASLRADPELALLVPLGGGWVFSVGGGVLVQADNVMRVQAGVAWLF